MFRFDAKLGTIPQPLQFKRNYKLRVGQYVFFRRIRVNNTGIGWHPTERDWHLGRVIRNDEDQHNLLIENC